MINGIEIIRKWFVKATSMMLVAGLVFSSGIYASGAEGTLGAPGTGGPIKVYLKPEVSIVVKGEERIFRNVNNEIVYPIIYNGSTYLPVRAISGIMEEDIEWDGYSKTIFMGKTFSNPNKIKRLSDAVDVEIPEAAYITKPDPSMVSAYLRPNFLIMYDFELQVFNDEQGQRVYPIVLNGSTYLPIRAVSAIMNQTIDWDGLNKIITIGSPDQPVDENSDAKNALVSQFEKQVTLYDGATAKIKNIQKASGTDELLVIAAEVSKDYVLASENTLEVEEMSTDEYDDNELEAYNSLVEFTQISEHYILVLENIAYMAAAEQDYSILAETFMTFAMESQSKLDQTRALVEEL